MIINAGTGSLAPALAAAAALHIDGLRWIGALLPRGRRGSTTARPASRDPQGVRGDGTPIWPNMPCESRLVEHRSHVGSFHSAARDGAPILAVSTRSQQLEPGGNRRGQNTDEGACHGHAAELQSGGRGDRLVG